MNFLADFFDKVVRGRMAREVPELDAEEGERGAAPIYAGRRRSRPCGRVPLAVPPERHCSG